jgi:peptidoglycan/LPS O-acetylase OafA/YrhL
MHRHCYLPHLFIRIQSGALSKLLSIKPLEMFSTLQMPFYLFHQLVIIAVGYLLGNLGVEHRWTIVGAFLVTLGVSYLWVCLIRKTAQQLRKLV